MEFQRHQQDTDEYLTTALQIFDYCGAESSGTLCVDDLMEKFAPFIKTNKAEYSHLRSLLDPEKANPEINVTRLAFVLNKYSQSLKIKLDLDESFNLSRSGPIQDSDSGISADGFHYLEELQCELKEKAHTEQQLRRQLELHENQHEETLAAITAERDSLLVHLNMLRDENVTLTYMRREHEETSDRLCASEEALNEAKRELEAHKKKTRVLVEQVACLETEKLTLQELLSKSKDECHRINEMYASRQSALLEENETLKTEHAELTIKLQDQEEFMQQIIKEKVELEMELKELLNKTNQTQMKMDRSIDVSFIEDLTTLDSINADTRFDLDQATVSTQTDVPCAQCEKHKVASHRGGVRRFFWDCLKSLVQIFAVVCFCCAVMVLYNVTRRWHARCGPATSRVPWGWLHAQDLMDFLLRIEYANDVPM